MDSCCNLCERKERINDVYGISENCPLTQGQQRPSCRYARSLWKLRIFSYSLTFLSILTIVLLIFLSSQPISIQNNSGKNDFDHGAVATDNEICSKIGINILQEGGNAVDAAVASTVCMTVVAPEKTGLGGGGIAMVYNNNNNQKRQEADILIIDFATNTIGGVFATAGIRIPSVLRGLELLHSSKGKLAWSNVIKPAMKLAREGFVITRNLAEKVAENSEHGITHGNLIAGEIWKLEPLAETLEAVGQHGTKILYNGTFSMKLWRDTVVHENLLDQLSTYEPKVINAKKSEFYQYAIYSPEHSKLFHSALETIQNLEFDTRNSSIDTQQEVARNLIENNKFGNPNPLVDSEKYRTVVSVDSMGNFVSIVTGMSVSLGLAHMTGAGFLLDTVNTGNNLESLTPIIFVNEETIGVLGVDDPVLGTEILSNLILGKQNISSAVQRQRYYQYSSGIKMESSNGSLENYSPILIEQIKKGQSLSINYDGTNKCLKSVNAIVKEKNTITSHSDSRGGGIAYRY